jgi:threonine dehydrogenase-like Zn-dependent dehydrogenase
MKAVVVVDKGVVEIRDDVPIPEPGDYEALVKVHACGFCSGTDFQVISGTLKESGGFMGYPTVLGHEGSGEVIKIGKKVRYISIGERFIHNNLRPEVGNGYTKTYGGMAEYGLVCDHEAMLEDGYSEKEMPFFKKQKKFPVDISYIDAGVLLSMSECHSAAINFGAKKGDKVLFYGAGPMGTALAMFMKLLGAEHITVIDSIDERLENVKKIAKADRTINFNKENVKEVLGDELFDLVVDAVGSSNILIDGSQFLKPGGKVCSLGVLKSNDTLIDVSKLKGNTALHMLNFPYGEYDIMPETIKMIQNGLLDPKNFYSHIVYYEDIHKAMDLVKSKEAFKVILNLDK